VLWLTAFLGVAVLGVLVGILVAIVLSLADFVRRAWRPYDAVLGREDELKGYHDLERHPNARQVPGLLLYRFDAPLFFANAGYFRGRISDLVATTTPRIRWVVVAAEPITDVDTTAADALLELLRELRQQQVVLAFAEMKGPVKERLRRYGAVRRGRGGTLLPHRRHRGRRLPSNNRHGVGGLGGAARRTPQGLVRILEQ
jgi:MFS superfamily sulfate permease-like transporter